MEAMHGKATTLGERGFTMIEQIMTLVIVAVLLCLGVPSMRSMLAHQRIRSTQMDIIGGLQNARATAIIRSTRIVFCPTRDGSRCSDETQWNTGWLMGPDHDRDDQPDGHPLYVGQPYAGIGSKRLTVRSTEGRDHVIFQPSGTASGTNLTISICDLDAPDQVLVVRVSNTGRVLGVMATPKQAAACLAGT